jgi:ligand-binding sensor domain-containing protein/signal transduction histidine kinase
LQFLKSTVLFKFKGLLLLVFNCWLGVLSAQIENITIDKGLSNRDVSCILQTKNGFMWFGTLNGLNRYDGYTFKEYNYNPHIAQSLSNGRINCLLEDENEMLWIGTENGLNILNQKTGEITKHFIHDTSLHLKSEAVRNMCFHYDKSILVCTASGMVYRFENSNSYNTLFTINEELPLRIKFVQSIDKNNIWFILNSYSVYKYNELGEKLLSVEVDNIGLKSNIIFHPTKQNTAFVIGSKISVINTQTAEIIKDKVIDSINANFVEPTASGLTKAGELWVAYNNAELVKYTIGSTNFKTYTYFLKPYITGAPRILYEDFTGSIWTGTNYGILKFTPPSETFESYLFVSPDNQISEKYSLRGIIEDEHKQIYIGGYKGLLKFNPETKAITRFEMTDIEGNEKANYYPFSMLNDTNGYIWIVSEGIGFYRFNKKNRQFDFPLHKSPDSKHIKTAFSLLHINEQAFLVGTSSGLYVYNKKENSLKPFDNPNTAYNISDLEVMHLIDDKKDSCFWLGSYTNGLYKLHYTKGVTAHYSTTTSPALSHNSISALVTDSLGNVWIGTVSGGVNYLDVHKNTITSITKNEGLADNIIAGILMEHDSVLWISTFNGLSRYAIKTGSFTNYFEKSGLNQNEFNIASYLQTADGKMYVGGPNGFNAFYPSHIPFEQRNKTAKIFLTRLIRYDGKNDEVIDVDNDLSGVTKVNLSYDDKYLSLYFALADYSNQSNNKFYYKFEGIDKEWVSLGTSNFLRFNNLTSGNYLLRIKAQNSEGVQSENEIALQIIVSSVFYKQLWFFALVLFAALLIAYSIFKYRLNQQIKLQKLRIKISSDLHDEVGSILTRIGIQAEMIKQGIINKENANDELSKIARESRLATASMSDVLWSFDARNDKMGNLVDHMREHAEEMLSSKELEVHFKTNKLIDTMEIGLEIRQNLFFIFKEAINNIVKHSNATRVEIDMYREKKHLCLRIFDNGTDVQHAKKYQKGQGLKNMQMRAKNIHAHFELNTQNGFDIFIKLPL